MVLVIAGMSNAVNLTDGLDGLAIGLMIIAAGAMTILRTSAGTRSSPSIWISRALPGAAELTIFCGAMTGASHRLSLVQRASGGDLHGRRGIARARRQRWAWSRC